MHGVKALDSTAMNALDKLRQQCEDVNCTLYCVQVGTQPMKGMEKSGFTAALGEERFLCTTSISI